MIGIEHLGVYLITALLFIITPGIDTVFVLNKSIGQGKTAGIFATLGVSGGIIVHTLFAALGLSAILAQSATAFLIIKYLGATYLIYLGIRKLYSKKSTQLNTQPEQKLSNQQHFLSGLISNTLNPKVALFFLSFFPQFIKPSAINSPQPFIILGLIYVGIGIVWFLILTYFSAMFSKKMTQNVRFNHWLNRVSGLVFVLMGIRIALSKK